MASFPTRRSARWLEGDMESCRARRDMEADLERRGREGTALIPAGTPGIEPSSRKDERATDCDCECEWECEWPIGFIFGLTIDDVRGLADLSAAGMVERGRGIAGLL